VEHPKSALFGVGSDLTRKHWTGLEMLAEANTQAYYKNPYITAQIF